MSKRAHPQSKDLPSKHNSACMQKVFLRVPHPILCPGTRPLLSETDRHARVHSKIVGTVDDTFDPFFAESRRIWFCYCCPSFFGFGVCASEHYVSPPCLRAYAAMAAAAQARSARRVNSPTCELGSLPPRFVVLAEINNGDEGPAQKGLEEGRHPQVVSPRVLQHHRDLVSPTGSHNLDRDMEGEVPKPDSLLVCGGEGRLSHYMMTVAGAATVREIVTGSTP